MKKYIAAKVHITNGKEYGDLQQEFDCLSDAENYIAGSPVSKDGNRPWIRDDETGTFLVIGGRSLQSI